MIANNQVVASNTFDQRSGGDQWHAIANVALSPGDGAYIRMSCQGDAPCIADAIYLQSEARYNDGSTVNVVTLQPMDGIILAGIPTPPDPVYRMLLPLIEAGSNTWPAAPTRLCVSSQ